MNIFCIRQFIVLICLGLCIILLASCALLRDRSRPMSLETAIHSVATELMMRVRMDRGLLSRQETTIVIDPFVNADNGEVLRASKDIERMIIQKGRDSFDGFTFVRMTSENLRKANYAMNGAIRYTPPDKGFTDEYYKVSSSVVNLKTGKVVGRSDVRVSKKDMDYTSTLFYKDSPMYIKDRPLEGAIETATSGVGSRANRAYYDALETLAMLVEAETAYESGNYRKSLALLEEVMKRPDGQLMKTYAGLYSTYYRLGHLDLAEKAFDKLLSISVEKNRILTVKFLFDVNSLEFWRDPNLKAQYGMWLRRIGKYFYNSLYCLKITGHCSRSGGEQHNNRLSLERAYRIQQLLQAEFPDVLNRSEAVGRGFKDNIVGTGTDDERDAIDRRVEFFVVDCE